MAHNIEINEVNGEKVASFAEYGLKDRAWHRLGQVFETRMSVEEALKASHADFEVGLFPLMAVTPTISEHMATDGYPLSDLQDEMLDSLVPNRMVSMRLDKMKPLGVVSGSYGIVQNVDAFKFIDTLCTGQEGDHVPVIESAGVLGSGERIFITAKFPDSIILDNKGDDKVEMYMVFTTSHDGTGSVRCVVTPVRVVCNNTLNIALQKNSGSLSLRHSSNVMRRLDLASKENAEFAYKALNLMSVYKKSLEERFEHLRNIRLSERDLDNVLASVALSASDYELFKTLGIDHEDIATTGRRKFNEMKLSVEQGIGQDFGERGTGLWAINGITSYYQNTRSFRNDEVKFDSILDGYTHKKVLDAVLAVDQY